MCRSPQLSEERFPFAAYGDVLREMRGMVLDRDAKGRNTHTSFYDGFPHGSADLTFELSRRIGRILGAEMTMKDVSHEEQTALRETLRSDVLDAANYCVFLMLMLDHEQE